jgi:hypothetical protein
MVNAYKGGGTTTFYDALGRLSPMAASVAAAHIRDLLERKVPADHEWKNVSSYHFQDGEQWLCVLIGIGRCCDGEWFVGLELFALDEEDTPPPPARPKQDQLQWERRVRQAQQQWDSWLKACSSRQLDLRGWAARAERPEAVDR